MEPVWRSPRVYLAGRIGKTDWRHGLFGLRHVELRYLADEDRAVLDEPAPRSDGFDYAGPFFLSDDHGCFHGPHGHGLTDPGHADHPGMRDREFPGGLDRSGIVRSCVGWLRRADALFCWLDDLEAYGTLVELGFAAALGLPIYLALDLRFSRTEEVQDAPESAWMDLWFARELATEASYATDPQEAWGEFCAWWRREMAGRYWLARRKQV